MNKIIFQVGLLAFCVASVIFMTQDMDVMDAIARAFIVFIVVVSAFALILFVLSHFASQNQKKQERPRDEEPPETPPPGQVVNQTDAQNTTA